MATALTDRVHQLRDIHQHDGVAGTVFSITRFLGASILPEPYATRYQFRSKLIEQALTRSPTSRLPRLQRLKIAVEGFDERLYYAYGFDQGVTPDLYLSQYSRRCARSINENPDVLKNKELFYRYLTERGLSEYLPRLYGLINNGRFTSESYDDIGALAEEAGRIVIKEVVGGGGNRVYIGTWESEGMRLYGKSNAVYEPQEILPGLERAIVTEFCEQAAYLRQIYPHAANTIRLITMTPETEGVFIPAAVHRIGTNKTGVLDNFSQGGMSADISLDTGELSAAAQITDSNRVQWHSTHPNTNAQIQGFEIPKWAALTREIRRIASTLPELTYVGWDVLVTSPGEFVFVEANHAPDPDVIQVHRPLLADARVRDFFAEHDIPV